MSGIINRDELRRLEKAARDKNKAKLADWIKQFEYYIESMLKRDYANVINADYNQLKAEGVTLDTYDSDLIYKKYLNIFDTDLVKFLKNKHTKIITICGSSKFKEEILKVNEDLTMQNYIVFIDGVFEHTDNIIISPEEKQQLDALHKEKILISDAIYVVNKDGYIGESTKSEIEFAKDHNKEIMYMEEIVE